MELKGYFHVDFDSMFQNLLYPYIILALSTLSRTIKKLLFGIVLWHTQLCFHPFSKLYIYNSIDVLALHLS